MKFSNFHEVSFRQSVDEALKSVSHILNVNRNPRLAQDVDHSYNNKFDLANLLTNVAIISHMNALERMGLSVDILKTIDTSKPTILRFQATDSKDFKGEEVVKVSKDPATGAVIDTGNKEKQAGLFGSKSTIRGVMHNVTEYRWNFCLSWELTLYSGGMQDKHVLQKRESSMDLITQTEDPSATLFPQNSVEPLDLDLSWLLRQIDFEASAAKFKIDVHDSQKTKTPRRNVQMDDAMDFFFLFKEWVVRCSNYFQDHIDDMISSHDPAQPETNLAPFASLKAISADDVFCPIHPLMKEDSSYDDLGSVETVPESKSILNIMAGGSTPASAEDNGDEKKEESTPSPLLSNQDMNTLLNEQIRTLEKASEQVTNLFSSPHIKMVTITEATFVLMCEHIGSLANAYTDGIEYLEHMLKKQLIAAIGKTLNTSDLDQFIQYQNKNILREPPTKFCHPIRRRPNHTPDGLLSIETKPSSGSPLMDFGDTPKKKPENGEPIETMCRKIVLTAAGEENGDNGDTTNSPLFQIPLNAGTTLEMTGNNVYLHGWLQHSFHEYSSMSGKRSYQLIARARQFSSFILVIGSMVGPHRLEPKDAIILQNKDEVLIPLLLSDLPTPKEFKDSIQSLSPEQQRFAMAFRSMQLSSSVFGVCVIQIKPQLEALLGLAPDSLTKEMKLTQELIELFAEYQIPSDILSYDGEEEETATAKQKVANVKEHVQGVLEVIEDNKRKKEEQEAAAGIGTIEEEEGEKEEEENKEEGGGLESLFGKGGGAGELFKKPVSVPTVTAAGIKSEILTADDMMSKEIKDSFLVQGMLANKDDVIAEEPSEACSESETPFFSSDALMVNLPTSATANKANMADVWSPDVKQNNDGGESSGAESNSVNFTMIPKVIDQAMEKHDSDNAVRATIIKTRNVWTRKRQENLLTKPEVSTLSKDDIGSEKQKAFDLLDALCRSGSLPISCGELHVIVSVTHSFENDVMGSVIQDNINPIEKLEQSALLFASAIYGVPIAQIMNPNNMALRQRLTTSFPTLQLEDGND